MPKQGQSVESCIISEFKVKVGDSVKVGDVLFGYETDKATFEEASQVEGTVLAIFWADGDEIPVLQNVMVIGQPGESFEEFKPSAASAAEGAPSETVATRPLPPPEAAGPSHSSGHGRPEVSEDTPSSAAGSITPGAPVSPRARMMAVQKGVNTAQVAGSGPGGRIIARDVEAAAAAQGTLTGLAKAKMAQGGLASPGTQPYGGFGRRRH